MNDMQINQLATICTRYSELRSASKTAADSLNKLKFQLFSNMLTPEEMGIIKQAQEIADRVSIETSQRDATNYFNSIFNSKKVI